MYFTDEILLSVNPECMNGEGFRRRFYSGATVEYRKDMRSLKERFGVRRLQQIWIELRREKIVGLMKRFSKPEDVAKELGISYYFLQVWGKECGLWPSSREVSSGVTMYARLMMG